MIKDTVLLKRSRQSLFISRDGLSFIFNNLYPPFEHGVHLYTGFDRQDLLIFDEGEDPTPCRYIPSTNFLELEKRLKKSGYDYSGFFHNHNYTDKENDSDKKLLVLPSSLDMWNNIVEHIGIVRNFRDFSDLRIFLRSNTDHPYPPRYFITMDTHLGIGTRIIKSMDKFLLEVEEKIEFEDTGYVYNSILSQVV